MHDIRDDFPLLNRRISGEPIIYLDSAATSLSPRDVLAAQYDFAANIGANVHRSQHSLGEEATFAFANARRCIARFLSADPECTILTSGATASLNIVARGLALKRTDRILVPSTEHHSNLVPWMRASDVAVFECSARERLSVEELEVNICRVRPKVFAVSYVSNVTGLVQDIQGLCTRARELGVTTVVDASQAVPHLPVDVTTLNADFLAFSGHKVLGPTGIGVLWGRRELLEKLAPLCVGGGAVTAVDQRGYSLAALPKYLEAGTPNISGAIGLAAAVEYLQNLGWQSIQAHGAILSRCLQAELESTPGIHGLVARGPHRIALGSFTIDDQNLTVERLASILSDTKNIMVRAGLHCAHPLFAQEKRSGAVRVSAYIYNTVEELTTFGETLRRILHRFA